MVHDTNRTTLCPNWKGGTGLYLGMWTPFRLPTWPTIPHPDGPQTIGSTLLLKTPRRVASKSPKILTPDDAIWFCSVACIRRPHRCRCSLPFSNSWPNILRWATAGRVTSLHQDCGTEQRIKEICELQRKDPTCQKITEYCCTTWPRRHNLPVELNWFLLVSHQISIVNGLIMRGNWIVIPSQLQPEMLQWLHNGHWGIMKCPERARQFVWWPGLSGQLKQIVQNCQICCKNQSRRSQPLQPTSSPKLPWQQVGTDLFEWQHSNYVIIVDYYSRFIEIARLAQLSAKEVINHTKSIFTRHGIHEIVFSDNGPPALYPKFAKDDQFEHVTLSPYYPQSNGEAEYAGKTIKSLLQMCDDPYLALLTYHSTPFALGYSPAELLMNRVLCSTVPTTREQRKPRVPAREEISWGTSSWRRDRREIQRN